MININTLYPINSQLFLPTFAEEQGEINEYFKVLEIFKGGMGGCLKIRSKSGKDFALKIILPESFTDEISLRRYLNEVKNWMTFSMCDGVLDAYKILELNGIPAVISPWMVRGDLRNLMKIKERTVFYNSIDRIIGTLRWVYENYNTIHRDLKPANILIDNDYLPYVGDWGLSKCVADKDEINNSETLHTSSINFTQKGVFLGTFPYSSPEQLIDSSNIDCRSDIFAVGIIMYEWITGVRPFTGSTLEELTTNILKGRFKKLDRNFNPVNFGIEPIINKCLEIKPENRFSTYQELHFAIRQEAKDVSSFIKYIPKIKEYKDILNPHTIKERIFSGEIQGHITYVPNGSYILTETEYIREQISIAQNIGATGEYEKAINLLKKILPPVDLIKKFPDLPVYQNILINLSYFFNKTYQPSEAEKFLKILEGSSNLPISYYINLSNSYLLQKNFSKSLDICVDGMSKFGDDPDLLGNACLASTYLGNYDEAIAYGNKRIKINPSLRSFLEYAVLLLNYGDSLKEIDFPEAIKMYRSSMLYIRKAKEFNPNDYDVNQKEAELYFKFRRYVDSSRILGALEYNQLTLYWLAKNMLWTGGAYNGISFCDKHLPNLPNSTLLKRIRCECIVDYCLYGENRDNAILDSISIEFLNNILNDQENRIPSDLRQYGIILYWQGKIDGAYKIFRQAQNIFPKEWTYSYYIAHIFLSKGDYQNALKEALNAKQLAPWREKVYNLLSKCYSYLEEYEKAAETLKRSKEIIQEKERLYESCKNL